MPYHSGVVYWIGFPHLSHWSLHDRLVEVLRSMVQSSPTRAPHLMGFQVASAVSVCLSCRKSSLLYLGAGAEQSYGYSKPGCMGCTGLSTKKLDNTAEGHSVPGDDD